MNEGNPRREAETRRIRERPDGRLASRPDRIALWAFVLAVMAMVMAAASAHAGSGGVTLTSSSTSSTHEGRYVRIWDRLSHRDHRWAHKTSDCESGGDPKAISSGGTYRGAFQFTKRTWRNAPKSPGGDPIRYRWKTQAVVAVLLKHRVGTSPWPVCG